MPWLRKTPPHPTVHDEREQTRVEYCLQEMNRMQAEVFRRIRCGEKPHSASILMLEDTLYGYQRELLHEQGVIPVINRKTGRWGLFLDGW